MSVLHEATLYAGRVRREAFDYMDEMPSEIMRPVGVLLSWFDTAAPVKIVDVFKSETITSLQSRFRRAGYLTPRVMLDALRLRYALHLAAAGWTQEHIALCVGHTSSQAYRRWFQRLTGYPSSYWRQVDADSILRDALTPYPQTRLALTAATRQEREMHPHTHTQESHDDTH